MKTLVTLLSILFLCKTAWSQGRSSTICDGQCLNEIKKTVIEKFSPKSSMNFDEARGDHLLKLFENKLAGRKSASFPSCIEFATSLKSLSTPRQFNWPTFDRDKRQARKKASEDGIYVTSDTFGDMINNCRVRAANGFNVNTCVEAATSTKDIEVAYLCRRQFESEWGQKDCLEVAQVIKSRMVFKECKAIKKRRQRASTADSKGFPQDQLADQGVAR